MFSGVLTGCFQKQVHRLGIYNLANTVFATRSLAALNDTQAENTAPKQDDKAPGRPSRRGAFDPRELWRLKA